MSETFLTHLECGACGASHEAAEPQTVCKKCEKPLLARYDLAAARRSLRPDAMAARGGGLWKWRELLPVRDDASVVTLGEGSTPLIPTRALGRKLRLARLFVKDEGQMPTGSFKARGLAVAISRAKELGIRRVALPSAGNAGAAAAAYGARAGLEVTVFVPKDTPVANVKETVAAGAVVHLVDGLITDAGRFVSAGVAEGKWFSLATLREPYRIEGKKTMGYELAEAFDWRLPDVVVYPTGGGTGLVGMWKAFEEMEALGWLRAAKRPRMISVQAEGCAPIVRAFDEGAEFARPFENAHTSASGLRVPSAIGDFLMLRAIRASGGCALAVSDAEMIAAMGEMAREEGLLVCPEGAACLVALQKLVARGQVGADESIVLFNTGTGLKYLELLP
ncbi:MAG: threonine synthase [Planctomycetes bacterium]|nr:threonine synthase [Planctomycetota bacterium]